MDIPTLTSAASDLDRYSGYGLEVLCANWTPIVSALAEPVTRACALLADAATADPDSFLTRFYQSQRG